MVRATILVMLSAVPVAACGSSSSKHGCPASGNATVETSIPSLVFLPEIDAWMVESASGEATLVIGAPGSKCKPPNNDYYHHFEISLCESSAGSYEVVEPYKLPEDGCGGELRAALRVPGVSDTRSGDLEATSGLVAIDSVGERCVHGSFDTSVWGEDAGIRGSFEAEVCEPCGEPGAQSCNGDMLETCTVEGYVTTKTCEYGCSSGRCNECVPSTTECRRPHELVTCGADGIIESTTTCLVGCKDENPASCFVLEPSNLPADICDSPGATDRTVSRNMVVDTDATCPGGVVDQGPGLPEICVFKFASYEVEDRVTVEVTGSRALAIVATESMRIDGVIDVSATGLTAGPGARLDDGGDGSAGGSIADGGGGAGYGDGGAPGGVAESAAGAGGEATGFPTVIPLVGGSRGGEGGGGAAGGGGGGALQLASCQTMFVYGMVHAGGGGGQGGPGTADGSIPNGGGGGGSGGAILLEAGRYGVKAQVSAAGGGGGAGGLSAGAEGTVGDDGDDAREQWEYYRGAPGGEPISDQGPGGDGGALDSPAIPGGSPASGAGGAGGGGGGVGRIRFNKGPGRSISETTSPTYSSGDVGRH